MIAIRIVSGLCHSPQRQGQALISRSFAIELAASILLSSCPEAVALNHMDSRPHLSPLVLPFDTAAKYIDSHVAIYILRPKYLTAWDAIHLWTPKGWKAELT